MKRHFDRLGVQIKTVQILNELNNPMYTPRKFLKAIPALAEATREVFGADTDVTATIVLAKPWASAEPFLTRHKDALKSLSSIGLDFYPGAYQYNKNILTPKAGAAIARQTLEAIATKGTKDVRRDFLSVLTGQLTDVHEFEKVIRRARSLFPNAAIDIGEFGFPTLDPIQRRNPDHEKLQSYAVEKIAKAFLPVVNQYKIRNIGFYELFDDKEFGVLNWGILNDKGNAKVITERLPSILRSLQHVSDV